jgi:hypothetical protein
LKKSVKKGHWAVFITIDGKDYLLGQVIVTVDGKINNYISEWKGEKLKSAISQLYELNDLLLIGNGYYSCNYMCTSSSPN